MPRHPVILNANEVRNHDPVRAAEMVEELILKGDSAAPAGGAYDLLGQIYLKAGDLSSARDAFLKNLEIYPDSEGTFCYMGLIEQILGNSLKAQEWYGKCPDRGFDSSYVDTIRSAHTKWQVAHPDAKSRVAMLISGAKPPSLGSAGSAAKESALASDKSIIKATLVAQLQKLQTSNPRLAIALAENMIRQGFQDVRVGDLTLNEFISHMKHVLLSPEHYKKEKDPTYLSIKADIAAREYIRRLGFPSVAESISSGKALKELGDQYVKTALLVMKEGRVIRDTSLSGVVLPSELNAAAIVEIPLYGPCKGLTLKISVTDFTYLSELFKAQPQTGGCFIATACYGSYDHPVVVDFRWFRDNYLNTTLFGRLFVKSYYRLSPRFADYLKARLGMASAFRIVILNPLHRLITTLGRRKY